MEEILEPGYYWVKLRGCDWCIMLIRDRVFYWGAYSFTRGSERFVIEEIDNRKIERRPDSATQKIELKDCYDI